MKSKLYRILALLLLTLMIVSPIQSAIPTEAASYKLNKKKVTLTVGSTYTLKVKGTSKRATWKTSNKKIATVSKTGKIKAKKAGSAKITAKVKKKTLTCKVTVKKKATSVPQTPQATQKPQAPLATQKPQTPQATPTPPQPTVTEESAYQILNSLRSTYPEGMRLTNADTYYSPIFGGGAGCYGFAARLSDIVFGTKKSRSSHSTFSNIKVGDNIRIGGYHSVIVLTKTDDAITVVEGNYNSSVHWDRKISSTSLASEGFTVHTRY